MDKLGGGKYREFRDAQALYRCGLHKRTAAELVDNG